MKHKHKFEPYLKEALVYVQKGKREIITMRAPVERCECWLMSTKPFSDGTRVEISADRRIRNIYEGRNKS